MKLKKRLKGVSDIRTHAPGAPRDPRRPKHDLIIRAIEAGETVTAVAERHDMKPESIRVICRKHGVSVRALQRARDREIVQRVLAGESAKDLAAEFQLTRQAIYLICKEHGAAIKKSPERRAAKKKAVRTRNLAIVADAKAGKTKVALAKKYGLSTVTISRIMREAGVKRNQDRNEAIIKKLREGVKVAEVAEAFGVSIHTIHYTAKGLDIPSIRRRT